MHSAKLAKSSRLQRVLKVLSDGNQHTTRQIIRKAAVCAVNSIVAELRANGLTIECERRNNLWYYWLAK
jgi:hypothetical protein